MNFLISDSTDKHLTNAIAHEYLKCKDCFDLFVFNESLRITNQTKQIRLRSYNLYSEFLLHLYEFYYGCFKRDKRSTSDIPHTNLDQLFNFEAQKAINITTERILNGRALGWENDLSYYQVIVPEDFGMHFRWIRNRHSHVDHKRSSGEEISLSEFYRKYHKFIYQLFSFASWIWEIEDIEKHDFQSIEDFETAISESN
jgi:hypothetical protein